MLAAFPTKIAVGTLKEFLKNSDAVCKIFDLKTWKTSTKERFSTWLWVLCPLRSYEVQSESSWPQESLMALWHFFSPFHRSRALSKRSTQQWFEIDWIIWKSVLLCKIKIMSSSDSFTNFETTYESKIFFSWNWVCLFIFMYCQC